MHPVALPTLSTTSPPIVRSAASTARQAASVIIDPLLIDTTLILVVTISLPLSPTDNGYIVFYLCDVAETGDIVQKPDWFKTNCHELERSPHPDCEAGTAKDCGPIDPANPGYWVLPCRNGATDQVFGGSNGKMAYKIPGMSDCLISINRVHIHTEFVSNTSCYTPCPLSLLQTLPLPRALFRHGGRLPIHACLIRSWPTTNTRLPGQDAQAMGA
jgi:hypothetical protein